MMSEEGPLNIWYVHPYAGGPGVGRYSRPYFLAQHWIKSGARATVFSASFHHLLDQPQSEGSKIVSGVPYEFVHSLGYVGNGLKRLLNMVLFSWNFFRNAPRYISQYGTPDVIVASSPHPYSFLAAHAVARKFGAKVFFEVRDLWPLSLVELAGVSPTHPLITITASLEKFAYKRADCVVSLLPLTKPHMLQRGLSEDRWAYIPNGIDSQEKRSSENEGPITLLVKRWKTEGCVVFVYAGALGRPNHVDSLLRATAILKLKGDKKVKILIVGRGEAEADLKRLLSELNLDADVRMFGQIPKNQVVEIFGEVDAGYISLRPESIFRFGISPNKLFDYMLAALPVVFAVSAGNDPVEEANCGFSAPAGDVEAVAIAMQKVVGLSVTQRREMGERGRAYVLQRHDYSSLAASYLALINR